MNARVYMGFMYVATCQDCDGYIGSVWNVAGPNTKRDFFRKMKADGRKINKVERYEGDIPPDDCTCTPFSMSFFTRLD